MVTRRRKKPNIFDTPEEERKRKLRKLHIEEAMAKQAEEVRLGKTRHTLAYHLGEIARSKPPAPPKAEEKPLIEEKPTGFKPTPGERQKGVYTLGAYELTSEEAKQFGYTLDPGWRVRVAPPPSPKGVVTEDAKPSATFTSPEGWEFRDIINDEAGEVIGYTALSPEGETFTKEELEALEIQEPSEPELTIEEVSQLDVRFKELTQQWKQEKDLGKRRLIGEEISTIEQRLRGAPEVAQPTMEESVARMELETSISALYPELMTIREGEDVTIDQKVEEAFTSIQQKASTDTEGFVKELKAKGRTPTTEGLLRAIGRRSVNEQGQPFTPEEIDGLVESVFQPVGEVIPEPTPLTSAVTQEGEFVSRGFFANLWDSIRLSVPNIFYGTKQYFTRVLPAEYTREVKAGDVKRVTGMSEKEVQELGLVFTAEEAAQSNRQTKQARDIFRRVAAENQEKHEIFLEKHPELQPPKEYRQDLTENWALLKDPGYWGYTIGEAATYTLAIMATTLAVTYTTKNPFLGVSAGVGIATPSISHDLYQELVDAGAPEDVAGSIAVPIGFFLSATEAADDLPLLSVISPFFRIARNKIRKEVVKKTVLTAIKKFGTTFGTVEVVNTLQEIGQDIVTNAFVGVFDEERGLFDGIDETALRTLIATSPFAIFGGAVSSRHVPAEEAALTPDKTGWEQDKITGEWYKPEKLTDTYNDIVSGLKGEGLTDEQAKLKALNEIAKTPEGLRSLIDSYAKVTPEEIGIPPKAPVAPEITPTPEQAVTAPTGVEAGVGEVTPRGIRGEEGFVRLPGQPEPVRTLSLEEVSQLETRIPIDLIRRDETVEIKRLTEEIRREGIKEPIVIRVREDGSQIVWDGIHRLIVAQDLGIKDIPVRFIGEEGLGVRKPPTEPKPPVTPPAVEAPVTEEVAPIKEREAFRAGTNLERNYKLLARYGKTGVANIKQFSTTQLNDFRKLVSQGRVETWREEGKTWYRVKPEVAPKVAEQVEAPTPKITIGVIPESIEEALAMAEASEPLSNDGVPLDPETPISKAVEDNTAFIRDIGIKERWVRSSRKVFEKLGQYPLYKGIQEAEVLIGEERVTRLKEQRAIAKKVDKNRRHLVFREANEAGSVGWNNLKYEEKQAVSFIRKWANEWADKKGLSPEKRIKDYIPHLFEEEMVAELKEGRKIDPALARMLDEKTQSKITDPFLKERLGATGFLEDPFAAMEAYDAVSLRVLYYEPHLQQVALIANDPTTPKFIKEYLDDYSRRMTGEMSPIDRQFNTTWNEMLDIIRPLPGGNVVADKLGRGNPAGVFSYNMTGVLYPLWMGYKATTAIRNLSQHTLIIAETGTKHFANGIRMRFTSEGKSVLAKSLALRSRKQAFLAGLDDSFLNRLPKGLQQSAMFMFRLADLQNVSDAFLAGYSEAKEGLPNASEAVWIARGDEVAADTQFLYTKMNSMAISQSAPGRQFAMLTTWTGNWMELMTKWISKRPSSVYTEYEQATGQTVTKAPWSQTYQSILMYILIVGLAKVIKDRERLKAWEYTGVTSLRYLAGVVGGEFPGLELQGAIADFITGVTMQDERMIKSGWNNLRKTITPSILKQLEAVATGEKDWLTLLFYLKGKDFKLKQLEDKWEEGWQSYEDLTDPLVRAKDYPTLNTQTAQKRWREQNPILEAQMFVSGNFTTLSSEMARQEVLRLIEANNIDTELIPGYDKIFGVDTSTELAPFRNRIGNLEKLVIGEDAEYFDMGSYAEQVHKMVNSQGKNKVLRDGEPLAVEIINAEDLFIPYEATDAKSGGRLVMRQNNPELEALLYLTGKVTDFQNPNSATELLRLMEKYKIPPQAINAFQQDPDKYDELFTQKFELEQTNFELSNQYENFGNTEAPNFIEDKEERKLAREQFKEDNPNWVADMRRVEAIDNDVPDKLDGMNGVDVWADRGVVVDEFGASSSEALVWLLDNPETYDWAIANDLLSDRKEELLEQEAVLRLNADLSDLEEGSEQYATVKRKIQAHSEGFTAIDDFVSYYDLPVAGFRQERYLQENPEFAAEMKGIKGIEPPDYIPPVEYDEIKEKETRTPEDDLRVKAYDEKLPFEHIDGYVQYYTLDAKGYAQERYLKANPEFYKEMKSRLGWKTDIKWDWIPTEKVETSYDEYNELDTGRRVGMFGLSLTEREELRYNNRDLDAWLVLTDKVSKPIEEVFKEREAIIRKKDLTPAERARQSIEERRRKLRERLGR